MSDVNSKVQEICGYYESISKNAVYLSKLKVLVARDSFKEEMIKVANETKELYEKIDSLKKEIKLLTEK